jgi:hypothetical protein
VLGELVDVDAAVGENAGVAVDPADGGGGGDDAFRPLTDCELFCSLIPRSFVSRKYTGIVG